MPGMERSVARVAVDMPLANLDRPFDYAVPDALDAVAQPGVRVKVRFAGRLRDGFILERSTGSERDKLSELSKVVSAEPVLSAPVAELVRDVADHYAGGFADVVRTAVPPRHAAAEKAVSASRPAPVLDAAPSGALASYPGGERFVEMLADGRHPRIAWTVVPTLGVCGDWSGGFVDAAAATLQSGRGALLLVPDARQLEVLQTACSERFGAGSFAVLSADQGPAARYRQFLAVARGEVGLVIGTRAAVFAPVRELGLIALWDDGNDSYAEPHAPYWHAREVAALRAHRARCGLVVAGYQRTAEVQQLVERGWLVSAEVPAAQARREAAAVRTPSVGRRNDATAPAARLPRDAFEIIRAGLAAGPVLVQVPRAGYLPRLVCAQCREPAACPRCGQALVDPDGSGPQCRWCGPVPPIWHCTQCGGARLRSPVVGVSRTAEELGKAFPQTPVIQASGDRKVAMVGERPALVLATPGAEPDAETGFAAAILLDAELMLARPELRVGEETLRRWLAVVAKVRPAVAGGTVLVVGEPGLREVQALARLDPIGYARAELAERRQAGFPPAAKLITIEGPPQSLADWSAELELPSAAVRLGPFPVPNAEENQRLTVRAPLEAGNEVLRAVRALAGVRAARKDEPVRVRIDPWIVD